MKILLINKSFETGGAAIAARRLWQALKKNKAEATLMVYDETSPRKDGLIVVTKTKWGKLKWWRNFIAERLYFLPCEKNKSVRFAFSPAVSGENISKTAEVKQADVVHLHWFNQGFLSLRNLNQLARLGKPIVWTLHDMWAFTGGCHYNDDCYRYVTQCGQCKLLKNPKERDLSTKIFRQKKEFFDRADITFVTCSSWLQTEAEKAKLLEGKRILTIPNPIDTQLYCPADRKTVRQRMHLPLDKKLILFGAANVGDARKGVSYLIEALQSLKERNDIEILLFGKNGNSVAEKIPFKVHDFGLLASEKIIELYQVADMFALPSLQDNLPNTVMESLSCGTPVVAFNIGGIPEMIDHQTNGYLATYKSTDDLAAGIRWVLENNVDNVLGTAARDKVLRCFSEEVVAKQFVELYHSLVTKK